MKNQKFHYIIFYILLLLPICITLIALFLMPERIPMHFNGEGVIDRWSSKYESLIIPILNLLFGLAFLFFAKKSSNQTAIILLLGADFGMVCFNVLSYYMIAQAFKAGVGIISICAILFTILGFGLISFNTYTLCKTRKNKITSRNKKLINFTCATGIICGSLLMLFNLLPLNVIISTIVSSCILFIYLIILIITFFIARRLKEETNESRK